jgi:hypothetical protein
VGRTLDSSALVLTLLCCVASETTTLASAAATASQPYLLNHPNGTPAANVEAARNDSIVIDFCSDCVDAPLEYFRTSRTPDGVPAVAERIRSSPGKRDGLYWPTGNGDDETPVSPDIADAAITEQPDEQARPFAGYYVKTLLAQAPRSSRWSARLPRAGRVTYRLRIDTLASSLTLTASGRESLRPTKRSKDRIQ